jgi:hypothetical protein
VVFRFQQDLRTYVSWAEASDCPDRKALESPTDPMTGPQKVAADEY